MGLKAKYKSWSVAFGAPAILLGLALLFSFSLTHGFTPLWWVGLLYYLGLYAGLMLVLSVLPGRYAYLKSTLAACFSATLIFKAIIYKLFGFHLNKTIFMAISFSPYLVLISIGVLLAGIIAIHYGLSRLVKAPLTIASRSLLMISISFIAISHGVYLERFIQGDANILNLRESLPLFSPPQSETIRYGWLRLTGEALDNRFALPQQILQNTDKLQKPTSPPKHHNNKPLPDIIFVVIDSLRSQDIQLLPGLAPTITGQIQAGYGQLDHLSTANCTHFSVYSLLSGRLPNDFARVRQMGQSIPSIKTLTKAGYQISTAEAVSLDWYDTFSATFGPQKNRYIANENTAEGQSPDQQVTNRTLDLIRTPRDENNRPRFHLAYYHGTHFPYGGDNSLTALSPAGLKAVYHTAITSIDHEITRLLDGLATQNQLKDTILIITSDHGESFGENGLYGHSGGFTNEQFNVPLIVRGMPKHGIKTHTDIMPALLHQLGLSSRPQAAQPIVLASCGYNSPSAYEVRLDSTTVRFNANGGQLSLSPNANGKIADTESLKQAFQALSSQMK